MLTIALFTDNLTMARHYAARGVDYVHFHIDNDKVSLQDIIEILPWLEGLQFAFSSEVHGHSELSELLGDQVDELHFVSRQGEHYFLENEDQTNPIAISIIATTGKDNHTIPAKTQLAGFYTPPETEPGIADYEAVDALLDSIID